MSKTRSVQELNIAENGRGGYIGCIRVPVLPGFDPGQHISADCWIVNIRADRNPSEQGNHMKSESVTHGIYVIPVSANCSNTRTLTDVQIRDEFRHSLPCKIHGTKTLTQEREPRPR